LNQKGIVQVQEAAQYALAEMIHQMRMCPENIHSKFNTLLQDQAATQLAV
jgi:hypothetical protein